MSAKIPNPAAYIIGRILRISRPQIQEPPEYHSTSEALSVLRDVTKLTRESMAFKLGLSIPQYDRVEAGSYGGRMSLETIDKARSLAMTCNLPVMASFFRIAHVSTRQQSKRGQSQREDQ